MAALPVRLLLGLGLVPAAGAGGAAPGPPTLVRDINLSTAPGGRGPSGMVDLAGVILFAASRGGSGRELWRSDGTAAGTWMVVDLCPGPCSSSPEGLVVAGGLVYFAAADAAGQLQVWRSDGTAGGTAPANLTLPAPPSASAALGAIALFVAGNELYQAGGSFLGYRVGSILWPQLAEVSGRQVFVGPDRKLYATDGISFAGSPLRADLFVENAIGGPPFARSGDFVYFAGYTSSGENGVWRTDASAAGTTLVADFCPGFCTQKTGRFLAAGARVFFVREDDLGRELWVSDGSAAGTLRVLDLVIGADGSNPEPLGAIGSTLVFLADDGRHGVEPWRSDGTSGGTFLLRDILPGSSGQVPAAGTALGPSLLFAADDGLRGRELWRTDGTPFGTELVADIRPGPGGAWPSSLARIGSEVLLAADDGTAGAELWRTTGVGQAGTTLVADINDETLPSLPSRLTATGGGLLLAADEGEGVHKLWRSDGSAAGTQRVGDLTIGLTRPGGFVNHQGWLYLAADDGVSGMELWRSDGSPAGTTLVADLCPGSCGSTPHELTTTGSQLFFLTDSPSGEDLWRSDGTATGTTRLAVLDRSLWAAAGGGTLRLGAADAGSGLEPWHSDGTPAGTAALADLCPGSCGSLSPYRAPFALLGEGLVLAAHDGASGYNLWGSAGRGSGVHLLLDLATPAGELGPHDFAAAGGLAFFGARRAGEPEQLWRTDGTPAGTRPVTGFTEPAIWPRISRTTASGGKVYFSAPAPPCAGGSCYHALHVSDGTTGATRLTGPVPAWTADFLAPLDAQGTLYFAAADGVSGCELWRSDGTAGGTALAADISPGTTSGFRCSGSAEPEPFAVWNGRLFFAADDDAHGIELWSMDLGWPRATLLRSAAVTALDPLSPPLSGLLPLDPAGDAWRRGIVAGDADPQPGVLADRGRPLVLYALDPPATLRLVKSGSGEVAAYF